MRIVIVGAGLGGLCAAICFAKRSHEVQVLEQRDTLSPQGSGINVRPGASRIMHEWGLQQELSAISEETPTVLLRNLKSGNITMRSVLVDGSEHPDWGTTREVLIKALYDKALKVGAVVRFNVNVVNVGEDSTRAILWLKDGTAVYADLLLAADGINSRIRPKILADTSKDIEPILSETTFYGIRLDAKDIRERLPARLTDQGNINVWMGYDGFVVSRWNKKLRHFGGLYAIKSPTDQKGMWDEKGDIVYVRGFFKGSCPEMTTPLEMAETCDRWKLAELPDLPRWTSEGGRIALLGDSCHAMHPNAAQGFSQIVEDIGVLDYLISEKNRSPARVPETTRIWQQIRKPRVERIKAYAKWNTQLFSGEPSTVRNNSTEGDVKSVKNVEPDMHANFRSARFVKWTLDYDAIGEAKKYLKQNGAKL